MRTTLKRGLGRVAPEGNGKPVLPPGTLSPVNLYTQPPRRPRSRLTQALVWAAVSALVLVSGAMGGTYLYLHESVAALAPKDPATKRAAAQLDVVPANKPAVALVIGYDHRLSDGKNAPSRSDTIMLVRADPETQSISLLSFPRDLQVQIHCPGVTPYTNRINAAYARCGPQGSLQTVKALTGLDINYLITVNFLGFVQLVDKLGGVWMDVDRRYFNANGGSCSYCYAKIDLQPGYQKLDGRDALDYVRFRHTDSDLYRVARQQQFVKAFKSQIRGSFSIGSLPKVLHTITDNVVVAQGGGSNVSFGTVKSYAAFAYGLPKGHVFQTRIQGLEGYAELSTASSNVSRAVAEFTHPDVSSPEKATAVALGRKLKRAAPAAGDTTVTVLNGNGRAGSASTAGYLLGQRGYRILTPPNGLPANAPNFNYFQTEIYYDRTRRGAQLAAAKVANLFASAEVKRLPARFSRLADGAMLTAVVGQTFHERLASAPIDETPKREPPNVTSGASASRDLLRRLRSRTGFPLMVPTAIERSSWVDSTTPVRLYAIEDKHRAVRIVYHMGSNEYWGLEETNWDDAPALADDSFTRHIGGRAYDLYYNGPHLHMVVLRTPKARYWVINTLLDSMSNETMLAIAKGLRPLGKVK
ncbi:MAG: LytR family transcriptional regulator [Actinobacteria bacterium]|nr:MAG: LytR family transcriptional regulator [Actinomycetota bacterium]